MNPTTKLEFVGQSVLHPRAARQHRQGARRHAGGAGQPSNATSADSAALRAGLQAIIDRVAAPNPNAPVPGRAPSRRSGSATTSPSIRRSASPAARARGTGSCSTSRNPVAPDASRRRRRFQLLVLALGDVQQRWHEDPVLRRVGRRRRAEVPRRRPEGIRRRRDLHDRRPQAQVPELLQAPVDRRRTRRTASRTTGRSSRSRAAT